jgi:hypothetical protein
MAIVAAAARKGGHSALYRHLRMRLRERIAEP